MESAESLNSDIRRPVRELKRGKGRSRVTNGSKLLPLSDCRSATARRFRDLYEDIAADLGGLNQLSEGEKQLIRRAALLSAELERQEAMAARNDRLPDGAIAWKSEAGFLFDVDRYVVKRAQAASGLAHGAKKSPKAIPVPTRPRRPSSAAHEG
ncbi:MAG: hypothetical protein CR217_14920 [Beijerinckiaceae bacterium]|nr:MAG: hypothetical protein CR217_14920 [Beijerinckiaceae bacterium]